MRNTILFLFFAALSGFAVADSTDVNVIFSNLENKRGDLYIGWYDDAGTFTQGSKAVFKRVIGVEGTPETVVLFENIPHGTYAIAVFFDENRNGEMDKNFVGIPKEKYGFSNNIIPKFRAATFKEASFVVGDEKTEIITIRLK